MLSILIKIFVGYALLVGLLYAFQRHLMYFPDSATPSRQMAGVPDMKEVMIITDDGVELNAWYKAADKKKHTLIYFHGNGGNIGYRGAKLRALLDAGLGVLVFDYRGYGGNAGTPNKDGFIADGRAAIGYLQANGVPQEQWVFYGESIGTGVAAELADTYTPAALILESPYTRISDIVAERYWFILFARHLVKDDFHVIDYVTSLHIPTMILHAKKDTIIPFVYGKAVYEAANDPKLLWTSDVAGHNTLHEHGAMKAIIAFIDALN